MCGGGNYIGGEKKIRATGGPESAVSTRLEARRRLKRNHEETNGVPYVSDMIDEGPIENKRRQSLYLRLCFRRLVTTLPSIRRGIQSDSALDHLIFPTRVASPPLHPRTSEPVFRCNNSCIPKRRSAHRNSVCHHSFLLTSKPHPHIAGTFAVVEKKELSITKSIQYSTLGFEFGTQIPAQGGRGLIPLG